MRESSVWAKAIRDQSRVLLIWLKHRFHVGKKGNEFPVWAARLRPNSVRNSTSGYHKLSGLRGEKKWSQRATRFGEEKNMNLRIQLGGNCHYPCVR